MLFAQCVDLDVRLYYAVIQNVIYRCGMFHIPLLKVVTHYRYTVPNMCNNPSICPSSFPQFYNAAPFKWPSCDSRCKMLGKICRWMTFGTCMTACMREYTPALQPERATICIDVTVWAPLTVTCVSSGLNLLSNTPTMLN